MDKISLHRVENSFEVSNLSVVDFEKVESLLKIMPSFVELFFSDFELLVSVLHVSALVFVRATRGHDNELLLPCCLLFHIGICEKGSRYCIIEHVLVKSVYYSIDCFLSS